MNRKWSNILFCGALFCGWCTVLWQMSKLVRWQPPHHKMLQTQQMCDRVYYTTLHNSVVSITCWTTSWYFCTPPLCLHIITLGGCVIDNWIMCVSMFISMVHECSVDYVYIPICGCEKLNVFDILCWVGHFSAKLKVVNCRGGWTRSRAHKKWACCPIYNTVQNVSHDLKPWRQF